MTSSQNFKFDLTERFQHLPAAPIVEAVIHWRARAEKPWQASDVKQELTDRLRDYPNCQEQRELQLETEITADGSSTQIHRESWRGFRLTSADKRYIVQFNRDGLVLSRLAPYENWERFVAEGQRLWHVFLELAAPSEIQRLGVRFINRIVPIEIEEIGRYLAQPPKCLEPFGLPTNGFLFQSTHDVPGQPLQVRVVQTVQPPTPPKTEGFGLILDIDVFTTQAIQTSDEVLRDIVEKMHWLKNKAFFSLLKKSAIKSFKGPKA